MMEQLEEVPKMVSQHVVLPEPVCERIFGQGGVIQATKISSQDQKLQRTVEQDPVEEDKTTPQERISERMGKQIRGVQVTEISSTMEQILDDTRHEPLSRISERIRELRRVLTSFEKKKRKEGKNSFDFCYSLNIVCLLGNEGVPRWCAFLFCEKFRRSEGGLVPPFESVMATERVGRENRGPLWFFLSFGK